MASLFLNSELSLVMHACYRAGYPVSSYRENFTENEVTQLTLEVTEIISLFFLGIHTEGGIPCLPQKKLRGFTVEKGSFCLNMQ